MCLYVFIQLIPVQYFTSIDGKTVELLVSFMSSMNGCGVVMVVIGFVGNILQLNFVSQNSLNHGFPAKKNKHFNTDITQKSKN